MASRPPRHLPLEIVIVERDGRRASHLTEVPVVVRDPEGKFVFDARAPGPLFLSRLRKGLYTVTNQWDAWSFLRPVRIDKERGRVVFETTRLGII